MNNTSVFAFLKLLDSHRIYYTLDKVRDDAITIEVVVPGKRIEVEFFENGEIEIEEFVSDGRIHGQEYLDLFFQRKDSE